MRSSKSAALGALALLLVLVLGVAGALGRAATRAEERAVDLFRAVAVTGPVDVTLRASQAHGPIRLRGTEAALASLSAEVEGGVLRLGFEEGHRPRHRPVVELSCAALSAIELTGSGTLEAIGVAGEALSVSLLGSGEVHAAGSVERLTVELVGSGVIELQDLAARTARVRLSGSGEVGVRAAEVLDASVEGNGDVRYRGRPRVTHAVSGGGSIRAR